MRTVILAGGMGTRLQEQTVVRPKPMVEVGGKPILHHIMQHYASFGHNEFTIALGYKGELIKSYFIDFFYMNRSLRVDLGKGHVETHDANHEEWIVDLIDTGLHTHTGGRLKRVLPYLGNETFMMTYGDGVSDVDVDALLAFHRKHGKLATVTAVRPPARFGSMRFFGDMVKSFDEKPQVGEGWINGGFFVLEPKVVDFIDNDEMPFERAPLERLAREGQLMAFRHSGFWQCMDTVRDLQYLERLWSERQATWKAAA